MVTATTYKLTSSGAPLQIEGVCSGELYYMRARDDYISIGIGGEPVFTPDWYHEEPLDGASWAAESYGREFIDRSVAKWQTGEGGVDGGVVDEIVGRRMAEIGLAFKALNYE